MNDTSPEILAEQETRVPVSVAGRNVHSFRTRIHCDSMMAVIRTQFTFARETCVMSQSRDAPGASSGHPESGLETSERNRELPLDFDINVFLGAQEQTAADGPSDSKGWRHRLSGSGIPRSTGDIVFSFTISLLKKASSASLMVFLVVFVVLGPNASWSQLKWNILRGGPDDASLAQCEEIGEWFSLFDQHLDRLYRLLEDAGPPDSWDSATVTKVADLMPRYMDNWLTEMKKNDPPPVGRELNALYISFLENYGDYVRAIQEGDMRSQTNLEREISIVLAGIDIETRHIMNLCI